MRFVFLELFTATLSARLNASPNNARGQELMPFREGVKRTDKVYWKEIKESLKKFSRLPWITTMFFSLEYMPYFTPSFNICLLQTWKYKKYII